MLLSMSISDSCFTPGAPVKFWSWRTVIANQKSDRRSNPPPVQVQEFLRVLPSGESRCIPPATLRLIEMLNLAVLRIVYSRAVFSDAKSHSTTPVVQPPLVPHSPNETTFSERSRLSLEEIPNLGAKINHVTSCYQLIITESTPRFCGVDMIDIIRELLAHRTIIAARPQLLRGKNTM